MKSLFRVMVLTLVSAGILSAAAYPTKATTTTPTIKNDAAPLPLCDPWANPRCH